MDFSFRRKRRRRIRGELEEELALRRHLLDIGDRLGAASASATSDIFPLLAERLSSVVPIKSLTIWMVDHAVQRIRALYHSEREVEDRIMAYEFPIGDGATGHAVEIGKSVIANDQAGSGSAKYIPGTPQIPEHLLVVPVKVEEQVKVALTLRRNATDGPFLPEDARRAGLFGQHLGSAFLLRELAEKRALLARQVEQLEGLNRLKDEFVASVSHELRTPLTAIIGNVDLLAHRADRISDKDRQHLLESSERQAKRLKELLENLLAESRLLGGDPDIVPVVLGAGPFLEEVADTLRSRASNRVVETSCEGPVTLVTDRTLLYRILFNLGDNALKYSKGPVWLAARQEHGGVTIEVTDQGAGIPPEHLATIFERFRQLDQPDGHRPGGVGLGLHLSARVVEALGGRIRVDSVVGQGSTFALWLPKEPMNPDDQSRQHMAVGTDVSSSSSNGGAEPSRVPSS
ncbi:MAG TPA: GAF domain-containing sensor histidine kinase [Actinomycetota bacterium]|nr:GAF domain-containing sensor histidine kinase [Actinomycetota bacterium]